MRFRQTQKYDEFTFLKYRKSFLLEYKFFNLGARKFHFSKYKKFFQSVFFFHEKMKNFEVGVVKHKKFFNLSGKKFRFTKYTKSFFDKI